VNPRQGLPEMGRQSFRDVTTKGAAPLREDYLKGFTVFTSTGPYCGSLREKLILTIKVYEDGVAPPASAWEIQYEIP